MHVYSENISFCDFNSFRSLTGYRERYANSDAPWGAKEIFGYLSAIFLPFLWLWLANVTFKNLVTGIIVNSFLQDSNEKRYESTEEIVQAEVEELEKEFSGDNHRVRIDMMEPIVSHVTVDSQKTDKTDTEPLLVNQTISALEDKAFFMRLNYWKPFKWPYFEKHCRPLSDASSSIWNNCSFKGLFRLMKRAFSKLWKKLKSCCKKTEREEDDDDSIGFGRRITAHGGMTLDIEAPSTMSLRTNPMEMPEFTVYDFDEAHESDETSVGSEKLPKSRTAVNSSTNMKHPALSNSNLAQMIKVKFKEQYKNKLFSRPSK
jgi:general stress protein CsbA